MHGETLKCLTHVEPIIKNCLKLLSSNSRYFRSDNIFKSFLYVCRCYKPCLWNIPADKSHGDGSGDQGGHKKRLVILSPKVK